MAYKRRALVKRGEEAEFTIGETSPVRQRNNVKAIKTKDVLEDGTARRDVTIFTNGRRAAMVGPALVPGSTIRLFGKFSQRNTFVALELAAQG